MENWDKLENESGFVFYINHEKNLKQWDHPKFSVIKLAIDDCNYIYYPSYRLASKFRILQRSFFMDEISLAAINFIFQKHKLGNTENSLHLESCELEAVLFDIFFDAKKYSNSHDLEFACDLAINFVYNVFDCFRETKVQVFSIKILLAILSHSDTTELYKFLFLISADHNNCITRFRLRNLLVEIHKVIKYLHEDIHFDNPALDESVENCFKNSPGLVGVTENHFVLWLQSEPNFLSWMGLIFRLKTTETVIYPIKCKSCNIKPLMGLKYTCKKCSKYVQCQRCFFTCRISHSHKLTHLVKEYGGNSISHRKRNGWSFYSYFINLLSRDSVNASYSMIRPNLLIDKKNDVKPLSDVEPLSSPQGQLQTIIKQLESQNRDLQQILIFGKYSDKSIARYLEEYRIFMADSINKLKILNNHINIPSNVQMNINARQTRPESTPKIEYDTRNHYGKSKNIYVEQVSAITPATTMTEIEDHFLSNQFATNSEIPYNCTDNQKPIQITHNDLDKAIEQLQHILANVHLEGSMNSLDNTNLKHTVTEVEGMLISIIDNVESSRCNSVL